MTQFHRFMVSVFTLIFICVPTLTLPAEASGMTLRLDSFGENDAVRPSNLSFVIEFNGGPAATAQNCSDLGRSIGSDLSFDFSLDGVTKTVPSASFAFQDKSVSSSGLTCTLTGNLYFGPWSPSVESKPLLLSIKLVGAQPITHVGKLINPDFPGVLQILSPTKGQEISGFVSLDVNAHGAENALPDYLRVTACRVAVCEYGLTQEVELYPKLSADRNLAAGYLAFDEISNQFVIDFTTTGLVQIEVYGEFNGVWNSQKTLVNVKSDIQQTSVPWNAIHELVDKGVLQLGLRMDCGNSYLKVGVSQKCTLSFENPHAMSTVPIFLATSADGAKAKELATISLRTDQKTTVTVPVRTKATQLQVFAMPLGAPSAYASNRIDAPPPKLTLTAPASVRSGKAFKFTLTIATKNYMKCVLYRDDPRVAVAYFQIESGSVASTAVLKLSSSQARQEYAMLLVVCYPGNGQLEAIRPIKITR